MIIHKICIIQCPQNNDFFFNIDPVYNTLPNGLEKQCKNYDTSRDFKNSLILDKI